MKAFLFCIMTLFPAAQILSQPGWVHQNSGINSSISSVHFINEQTGWMTTHSNKILHTTNGGTVWNNFSHPNEHARFYDVFFINENTGWIGGGINYIVASSILLYTTDSGLSWNTSWGSGIITSVYFKDAMTGFLTVDATGDFGQSSGWIAKTTNGYFTQGNFQFYGPAFYDLKFNGDTGWATARYTDDTSNDTIYIFKSTDLGETWNEVYREANLTGLQFGNLENNGSKVWCTRQNKILLSTDYGDTWNLIDIGSENYFYSQVFFINQNTGWVCGFFQGDTTNIYKTINAGSTWFPLRNNYPNLLNAMHFINDLTGWVGGTSWPSPPAIILKTVTGGITSISQKSITIPEQFSLSQNFPNPFNPTTNIRFDIQKQGMVTLKVYDILGKEVAILVNETLQPGTYETNYDATGLTSGVYLYKLETEGFSEVKRMILLK